MVPGSEALQRGLEAFASQQWAEAHAQLALADAQQPLGARDLERLGTAAYLAGRDEESSAALLRAHHDYLSAGEIPAAVRCAFWLARGLLERGDVARGGGWITRARRLLENSKTEGVEGGYLHFAAGFQSITQGDAASASDAFARALEIAERFEDPDLLALARHGYGRALIRSGDVKGGVAGLDEAMVAVDAGEVSAIVVGEVYCSVIAGCMEVFDLRRAAEWTEALSHWCEAQPELVPYRGECLVRRAELLQLRGEWSDAIDAAVDACSRCRDVADASIAAGAWYQQGELHRLRGSFADAEHAYRQASRLGRRVQPGLALLRLAQGRVGTAVAAIQQALDEAVDRRLQLRLLPAYVEIMLAADNLDRAHTAAGALSVLADEVSATFVHALAAHARGALRLRQQDTSASVAALREACTSWQELEMPYEQARVRELLAEAYRALGDEDGAAMELDAARWIFDRLGAKPDIDRTSKVTSDAPEDGGVLTRREVQVLRLVATGRTNRAIAEELRISERTVARHVANIFTKLSLPSRAAATAYAYEHGLVQFPHAAG